MKRPTSGLIYRGQHKPLTPGGEKLRSRYLREREHLFTFFDHPLVEPTNNSSEQALRMSVIFRKVTNGFRSDSCTLLMLLQHMQGLSDKQVTHQWVQNPYWQYFCGYGCNGIYLVIQAP